MNLKDCKERFLFFPIICAVMLVLIFIYKIISATGFLDIDFNAIDRSVIKQNAVVMIEGDVKHPLIPSPENIGDGEIDINTATIEELDEIPGIGKNRAASIVEQRIRMGGFSVLRDIVCTEGIGIETYKKLEPYIKIGE